MIVALWMKINTKAISTAPNILKFEYYFTYFKD